MPVYLRNFYFRKLAEQKKTENDESKRANQKIKSNSRTPKKPRRFSGKSFK